MQEARLIDFVRGEAGKTNFQIQHFGAVINYTSRGVSDFERRCSRTAARPLTQPVILRSTPAVPSRGERRLALLTPQQYRVRFEQAKAELFRRIPFLANHSRPSGKLEQGMVQSHIIRQLGQETMDLIPMEALALPESLAKILPVYGLENRGTTL